MFKSRHASQRGITSPQRRQSKEKRITIKNQASTNIDGGQHKHKIVNGDDERNNLSSKGQARCACFGDMHGGGRKMRGDSLDTQTLTEGTQTQTVDGDDGRNNLSSKEQTRCACFRDMRGDVR